MAVRIPAEKEEVGTSEERRDNDENVFTGELTGNTTRNHHQYNDTVGDE